MVGLTAVVVKSHGSANAKGVANAIEVAARMVANVLIDYLVGLVPIFGDLFDFAFKANRRNAQLARRHLERRRAREV